MTEPDKTRHKIIAAAKTRIAHYGYGKTTMAELAQDCDMSPGNLYRYFSGKLDIAEAICRQSSVETAEELAKVVARPGRTAAQRVHDFLFEDLRTTFQRLEHSPKLVEMAHIVGSERPTFYDEGLWRERKVLRLILEMGNASGEFRVSDTDFIAEMIQSATMKFSYPQLFTRLPLDRLERELQGVYEMLIAGLRAGIHASDPAPELAPPGMHAQQKETA
ncbi:MAG: TetR/AcrR family transcriptional regulator [Parvibaculaceae bacterium]|nr:TetR/AcrR family transcriptional regulator [Parvibaculaceae bacterium]